MKKFFTFLIITLLVVSTMTVNTTQAKKSKKSGITEEQITEMSTTVDTLTKKIYGGSLFSPEDNEKLIDIKIKLDNQMLLAPDPTLAPLYYKAGNLYKAREYKDEAVDCFQTILENFSDTALAPKALKALNAMGVTVNLPQANTLGQ